MVVRDYAKSLKRQNVVLGIVLVLSVALIIFLGETGWIRATGRARPRARRSCFSYGRAG